MATMRMITETSEFMMSYVLTTDSGRVVIVDGGRPADVPLLKEAVAGRPIEAWFLTHPHLDHITAFIDIVKRDDPAFDIKNVYCHFPGLDYVQVCEPHEAHTLEEFLEIAPKVADKLHTVNRGDVITVDELTIEVLYNWEPTYAFKRPTVNDSTIVFRVQTPHTSVLFLGDLGPEGGDILMEQSRDKLKSEYCQMAHHGHMCVGPEVYMEVEPRVCMWNAPDWLWEEAPIHINYRMYGEKMTRRWMDKLGVAEHLVTKDGTVDVQL